MDMRFLKFGSAAAEINSELGCRLQGHLNRDKPAEARMDNLFAKAFAFQLGEIRLLIIACDLLEFDSLFIAELKLELRERLSLPQTKCLICASHTHTGPPTIDLGTLKADRRYLSKLKSRIIELSRQAFESLEEVCLRVAVAQVATTGVNRRRKTQDGVQMAPNPEGPVDRDLAVVRIDRADGTPVAAIAIFNAMFGWKFFIWPLIITNSPQKFVLEIGLASLANKNAMDYGLQMAGAVFSIVPILAVFLVLRQRFVQGVTMTGLKS